MHRFRELRVWQVGYELALDLHADVAGFPARERYGLAAQVRRCAVSVIANIAEGCGHDSPEQLARYVRLAVGSTCELESHLLLAQGLAYLPDAVFADRHRRIVTLRRMLRAFLHSIT